MCTFKNKTIDKLTYILFLYFPFLLPIFQVTGQITSTPVLLSTLILNNNSEGLYSDISIVFPSEIHLCNIF